LVGSSGEGGAKLHRRNFGEAVENLTAAGEYHWMAGNFMKYGADAASFGSRNAGDIPVDAHELIALCAPRPTFISYGIPEKGDAKWLDQQGSFMAAIAAQPVFRLLGAKTLGRGDDYKTEKMPPVNVSLLDGQLAWRQHDGGHTDAPNWKYFIPWADRMLHLMRIYWRVQHWRFLQFKFRTAETSNAATSNKFVLCCLCSLWFLLSVSGFAQSDKPTSRTDQNSLIAHSQLLEKAKAGRIDIYFEGDSITRRWGATDYPELLANWKQNFFGWNPANFGWGADTIQNILWRLNNGELDGLNPKVMVLLAGTNNVGRTVPAGGDESIVADITNGIKAILDTMRAKAPNATLIVMAIFPRNDNIAVMPTINKINANIVRFADGKKLRYLSINDKLADKDGKL